MQQDEYFQDIEIIKDDIEDIFDLDKLTENKNDDSSNEKTKNNKYKILKVIITIIGIGLIVCSIIIFI